MTYLEELHSRLVKLTKTRALKAKCKDSYTLRACTEGGRYDVLFRAYSDVVHLLDAEIDATRARIWRAEQAEAS